VSHLLMAKPGWRPSGSTRQTESGA